MGKKIILAISLLSIELIIVTYGFHSYTTNIIDGISDFERHRVLGFKVGFYMGASSASVITITYAYIIHVILENKLLKGKKSKKAKKRVGPS